MVKSKGERTVLVLPLETLIPIITAQRPHLLTTTLEVRIAPYELRGQGTSWDERQQS
jgi:hypothetical protein